MLSGLSQPCTKLITKQYPDNLPFTEASLYMLSFVCGGDWQMSHNFTNRLLNVLVFVVSYFCSMISAITE